MVKIAFAGRREIAHKIYWWLKNQFNQRFENTWLDCEIDEKPYKELDIDFLICVHYPYILSKEMLAIPKRGVVNLHPSYLPFNKGWHTASYALLYPQYPYGATLHMMTEDLDSGPIIHQKKIDILPEDTADSLYKRCMALEFEVFKEAWPALRDFTYKLQFQPGGGTRHNKKDLVKYQEIDHWPANIKDCNELLIRQLRALTTNDVHEAAYFIENGKKYYCQIHITPEAEIK